LVTSLILDVHLLESLLLDRSDLWLLGLLGSLLLGRSDLGNLGPCRLAYIMQSLKKGLLSETGG
jgi:hypothetical protein